VGRKAGKVRRGLPLHLETLDQAVKEGGREEGKEGSLGWSI